MANRYGNDYVVLVQADSAFNVDPVDLTSGWTAFGDKFELSNESPEPIDIPKKDQNIVRYNHTQVAGIKKPIVTLSGQMSYAHRSFLLGAMGLSLTGSDWTIDNANTVNSYTIVQQFATAEGNEVNGCVGETLTISGEAGGAIDYSLTMRAGTVEREATDTYQAMTVPTNSPFLFQFNGAPSLAGASITNNTSFELTITRIFPDDRFLFQDNDVWYQGLQCEIEGEFSANWIYDSANDSNVYDELRSGTTVRDTVTLNDAASNPNSLAIETSGEYIDYTLPDPDRCIFEGGFTKKLFYNGANEPITVTETAKS